MQLYKCANSGSYCVEMYKPALIPVRASRIREWHWQFAVAPYSAQKSVLWATQTVHMLLCNSIAVTSPVYIVNSIYVSFEGASLTA